MGLTQISTNGVKANTLTKDDIASGAITVSELAVDAVEDDRIKTSNSPSASQFLQYKNNSDKLTWADAASEGTDIKSTGESGTTKFLRVDGDGTCSWQVPPDNNTVYTHPNHSGEVTSTADGAQVIASEVVDEDNLKISNAGTNGQYLQKQSGNTGGLTWADVTIPAGGNSVDLVANGAIAAGKPVIIKGDGKAEQVKTVGVNYGPSNVQSASQVSSHSNMKSVQVAQNQQYPDWRVGICGFETSGNSAYIQYSAYNAVTASDSPQTPPQWTWSSDGLFNNTHISCHKFMPGRNFFITGTNASSNQSGTIGGSQFFTCSQASNGDITKKQKFDLNGKRVLDLEPIGVVSNAYTFMALITDNSSIYIQQFTVNSSGYISAGSTHSMTSTNGAAEAENGKFAWNSDYTRVGVAWVRQSDEKAFVTSGTWNGTAFSWAAGNQLNWPNAVQGNDWGGGVAIACDSISGKYVVTYQYNNQSKAVCVNPSANGLNSNYGTEITVNSGNPDGNFAICDNHGVENSVVWAGRYSSGLGCGIISISGSNTITSNGVGQAYNQNPQSSCNIGLAPEKVTTSSHTYYAVLILFRYSNKWYRIRSRVTTAGTNLTTHNAIGFAPSAISDGNTGTINCDGNTVTTSGLTTATRYYVANDGTFQTSVGTTYAGGVALSSTKLLIKMST